jgi:hypothetical protein
MEERGRAKVKPTGAITAIADDKTAQFPRRCLNADKSGFTRWRLQPMPMHPNGEMVYHTLGAAAFVRYGHYDFFVHQPPFACGQSEQPF